ncbi:ParB/RepB/Spo0J family partition protein [Pseudarthrobacter sp. O4]|uniref:ParB/RepB/Spo0J family partition protein n=1 Tax=Pseudarthrobacter sp. O4 TaxID=3418417 RepID=UPI003CF0E88C
MGEELAASCALPQHRWYRRDSMGQTGQMPIIDLSISDLAQDSIERSRPHLDPDRVSYYVKHLDESTPVVVFNVNGNLLLADGHHRVAAAEQLGRSTVRAEVREGKRSDALQFAIDFAQRQRGLPRQQVLDAIARRGQRPEGNP